MIDPEAACETHALLKNEADLQLFERLAFLARRGSRRTVPPASRRPGERHLSAIAETCRRDAAVRATHLPDFVCFETLAWTGASVLLCAP